jgi:hypothetical protein
MHLQIRCTRVERSEGRSRVESRIGSVQFRRPTLPALVDHLGLDLVGFGKDVPHSDDGDETGDADNAVGHQTVFERRDCTQ